MNVLGIWDGHDSGAALLQDGRLRFAVNEERLSRRKLEGTIGAGGRVLSLNTVNGSVALKTAR